ncbi:Hypothetical predicted protein [Olea europaea subsp. europaea]|uniref:Uncharacterized protein n=1 Tax=Olea europaea subsp. europaea TaxID=158383 RepID=A0A8S0UKM7_OLEEU|nr:Hypothetical predicted protein [Olea europaea subsp. europaea]
MAEEPCGLRKGCMSRNSVMGYLASPRNTRRSRRRLEQEMRDDKEFCVGGEMKRHSGRSKKDKLISVPSTPKTIDDDGCNLDKIGQLMNDLLMWKDVSKSSLWDANEIKLEFKLTDDTILKLGRLLLPAANVVPFFLIGAEYAHLITLWRLCALGFFISFTGPKLYSFYSVQLCRKVKYLKSWVLEAWGM